MGAFVVLLSVLVHGLTATPVMQKVEAQFGKKIEKKPTE
jgi:NhaP-type Na+/H+ or K+/H+ antiporter